MRTLVLGGSGSRSVFFLVSNIVFLKLCKSVIPETALKTVPWKITWLFCLSTLIAFVRILTAQFFLDVSLREETLILVSFVSYQMNLWTGSVAFLPYRDLWELSAHACVWECLCVWKSAWASYATTGNQQDFQPQRQETASHFFLTVQHLTMTSILQYPYCSK